MAETATVRRALSRPKAALHNMSPRLILGILLVAVIGAVAFFLFSDL